MTTNPQALPAIDEVIRKGQHSHSDAPCPACGDLDGCHKQPPAALPASGVESGSDPGEICDRCGARYDEVYRVPDELWAELTERLGGSGLLCMGCCEALAGGRGSIYWSGTLGDWPAPSAPSAAVEGGRELPGDECYATYRTRPDENEGKEFFFHALYHNETIPDRGERVVKGRFISDADWQRLDASESERQRDIAQADAEKLRAAYESALETIDCLNERLTASQQTVARLEGERDRIKRAWDRVAGFATCVTGDGRDRIVIAYDSLEAAQDAYSAMTEITEALSAMKGAGG